MLNMPGSKVVNVPQSISPPKEDGSGAPKKLNGDDDGGCILELGVVEGAWVTDADGGADFGTEKVN